MQYTTINNINQLWYRAYVYAVVIHFCNSVWYFWVQEANLCRFLIVCLSIVVGIRLSGQCWGFHKPVKHRHIVMPVTDKELDFHRYISWSFGVQLLEVFGNCSFFDIGGFADHHCFLFIILMNKHTSDWERIMTI